MDSYSILSDLELAKKIYHFDPKAIETLYDRYSRIIFSLINHTINDEAAAEEVLAEVFAIVWRKTSKFNYESGNFYTWLIQTARNKAVDYLERHSDELPAKEIYTDDFENSYIIPTMLDNIESLDLRSAFKLKSRLESAIANLDEVQKYIIQLIFYWGFTRNKLSKKLNIPAESIDSKFLTASIDLCKNLLDVEFKKQPNIDIIYYAAGALDKSDFINFKNNLENLSEREIDHLGIFQNIFSLLPVLIELRSPSQQAKNNTALRLRKIIFDPVKDKRKSLNLNTFEIESKQNFHSRFFGSESQNSLNNKPVVTNKNYSLQKYEPPTQSTDLKKILIIDFIIVLIISAVIGGVIYYLLQKEIERDKIHIESLNNQISDLSDEIFKLNENQKIFTILNSTDSKSFDLDATVNNPNGFGKVILASNGNEGVLQIFNMPILDDEKIYIFWLISKGQPFILKEFSLIKRSDYIYLEEFPPVERNNFDSFILTIEDDVNASSPSENAVLSKKFKL